MKENLDVHKVASKFNSPPMSKHMENENKLHEKGIKNTET